MNFINPMALWGLLALSIPIILLLFLQRKKLVIRWAAFEWMHKAMVRRRQKIKVTDILKLISKLLLMLALVLMISRPFLSSSGGSGRTLLVVDTSPSMGALLDEGTRLDKAVKLAGEFVARYRGEIAVFTFSGKLEPVVPEFTREKGLLRDRIRNIKLQKTCGGMDTLARQLPLQIAYGRAERLVFLGDFQSRWFGDGFAVAEELKRLGRRCPMTWVQVDDRGDLGNMAITDLTLSPEGAFAGRRCFFNARLLNGSNNRTPERFVTVEVDGKQIARTPFRLDPRESREFPFTAQFDAAGLHTVRVELDRDVLTDDNARRAVIDVPRPPNILVVAPAADPGGFPADTWFRAAVRSLMPGDSCVIKRVSPLEFEAVNLDDVDLVATFKIGFPGDSSLSRKLMDYLNRGGSVAAFLPAVSPVEAGAFGLAGPVTNAPGRIRKPMLKGTYLEFMDDPQLKPENLTFSRAMVFSNVPPTEVRLRTDAGVVALCRKVQKGTLVAVGFTPAPDHTDLPFNPNFVQFVLRLMWECRGKSGFYSDAGALTEWRADWVSRDHSYALLDEKNITRSLTLDGNGDAIRLVIPPDLDPGFYSIQQDGQEKARFGHNVDTGDSDLEPVRPADLEPAAKSGLLFSNSPDITRLLGRMDLTTWIAILLGLAILFEAYAHFFRDVKPGKAAG